MTMLTETVKLWDVQVGEVIESHDDCDHFVVSWHTNSGKIVLRVEKRGCADSADSAYTFIGDPDDLITLVVA